jgi:spoIIIJ-associated protein
LNKVEVCAGTVEEAVTEACRKLDVPLHRLSVRVLQEPRKGIWGLFARPARIEAERIDEDPVEAAIRFLTGVAERMGIPAKVTVEPRSHSSRSVMIRIQAGETGVLIGKRGLTLRSLEHLANIAANRWASVKTRIVLDVADYRKRREETLVALADRMALQVIRTGKEVSLEPMPRHERKIIHRRVQTEHRLKTRSIGEEPNRRVVIMAKS